jgi:hypothetical protein
LAFVRHPFYGQLAYMAAFFLHPPSRWWGQGFLLPIRWSLIASAVTLLAFFVHRKKLAKPAIPFFQHGYVKAYLIFVVWLVLQIGWALDMPAHLDLLNYYVKFFLVIVLIYYCVDTEEHLRMFLWAHVLGCFYFGWIAYNEYTGGRFEDFGGPGLSEANAGAITIVTGTLAASTLFIWGTWREKAALFAMIPFIVNGLVTTISRSGFLAVSFGGILYNLFTPKRFSKRVRLLSGLAVVLFLMLTGPSYWQRMQSMEALGDKVEGVDTGAGRIDIMKAQIEMSAAHPFGCGATCTAVLSKEYLDDSQLTGEGANRARASHNTFFTMLVEHGLPGAAFYAFMVLWILGGVRKLRGIVRGKEGFLEVALPALASILGAIFITDMFATYAKFEVRIWFLALLMAALNIATAKQRALAKAAVPAQTAQTAQPAGALPQSQPQPARLIAHRRHGGHR